MRKRQPIKRAADDKGVFLVIEHGKLPNRLDVRISAETLAIKLAIGTKPIKGLMPRTEKERLQKEMSQLRQQAIEAHRIKYKENMFGCIQEIIADVACTSPSFKQGKEYQVLKDAYVILKKGGSL